MLYRINPEVVHHLPDHVCRNHALLLLTRFHILKARHRNVDLSWFIKIPHHYQCGSFKIITLVVLVCTELRKARLVRMKHIWIFSSQSQIFHFLHANVSEFFSVDIFLYKIICVFPILYWISNAFNAIYVDTVDTVFTPHSTLYKVLCKSHKHQCRQCHSIKCITCFDLHINSVDKQDTLLNTQ